MCNIRLFVFGLFIIIIIYPFLHELGHIIMSYLFGGNVVAVNIFPQPSVLCDLTNVEDDRKVLVGAAGVVFPLLISGVFIKSGFWNWYMRFVIRGITLLSLILSLVALMVENVSNGIMKQDDFVIAYQYWHYGKINMIAVLLVLILVCILLILKEHPFKELYAKLFN